MNEKIKRTITALQKNHIKARYFENEENAIETILNEIDLNDKVGIGGSMTITQLELPQLLEKRGNIVYFHWLKTTPEEMDEVRLMASHADVYLTSTNALTERGQLVNIDGVGNRVTSMIFGPKKVFVICGVNKIVEDTEQALNRIKENAYKNARRLKLNTPCAVTGKCNDCESPQRMCSVTTIIEKKPTKTDLEVIIIGKKLGY